MNPGWTEEKICNFFQDIGYTHRGTKEQSLRVSNKFIPTEEFIKIEENGRHHILIVFKKKVMKIYGHYDLFLPVDGEIKHFTDRTEKKTIDEMYLIHKHMKKAKLGKISPYNRNRVQATLEIKYEEKLIKILSVDYSKPKKSKKIKYTKWDTSNMLKYTLHYIYQNKFIHVECSCSRLRPKYRQSRDDAKKELKRIMSLMYR